MFRISMKNIGELINRPAWVITNEKCVDKACRIRNKNNYTIYGGRIVRISIEDAGNMSQPCLRAFAAVVIDEKEFSREVVLFPRICCLHTAQGGKHHQWDILQPAGTRVQGDGSGRKSDHPHTENQCFL